MASHARTCSLSLLGAMLVCNFAASGLVSLREAGARKKTDYLPLHSGETLVVRGRVATKAIPFLGYTHLAVQDAGAGLLLESATQRLDKYEPGEDLEVRGVVGVHDGLAVLYPAEIKVLGRGAPALPEAVPLEQLQGFKYIGRLVTTEARVVDIGENSGGTYLLVGDRSDPYKIFVPFSPLNTSTSFAGFVKGDLVRATGISTQYCPTPPYNRRFELLVRHSSDVTRLEAPWVVHPAVFLGVLLVIGAAGMTVWYRERRTRAHRERVQRSFDLAEEVLGAASAGEILKRARMAAPAIFQVTGVNVYAYNRGANTLDLVQGPAEPPMPISLEAPAGAVHGGAVACFQNRALLAVPDTTRMPLPEADHQAALPRSLLFVPMFAQGDAVGVFTMEHRSRVRHFSADDQALAQHLGNQIGVAIRLLEQISIREQLFRTEKLAAVGRLISGVVNELQIPLASISRHADNLLASVPEQVREHALHLLSAEARKASDIVGRLVSFGGAEQVEAKPVEVNRLLRQLIEFREREWKSRGIKVHDLLIDRPLVVLGSHGQLEQVFLKLLVHAEQAVTEVSDKAIGIRSGLLAKRILIEITYTRPRGTTAISDPFSKWSDDVAGSLGLGVCRSIVAGHGGEVRLVQSPGADPRFEIELPWAQRDLSPASQRAPRAASQHLTALVLEPDETVQWELLSLLSARGFRVIPANNSDAGLDLSQRLRFDVAFCSVRLPGLNWVELSEEMQHHVGAFVLLSDGYDAELVSDFEGENRFVLSKPIEEDHLDRILDTMGIAPANSYAVGD